MRVAVVLSFVLATASVVRADAGALDFGFADERGERLIVVGAAGQPRYARAWCQERGDVPIEFVARQAGVKPPPDRQIAKNFSGFEGDVYKLPTGGEPNETCLVRGATTGGAVEVTTRKHAPCDAALKASIGKIKQRAVVSCQLLARLGMNTEVATAVMKRQGRKALAVLVVREGKRMSVRDYPAECKGGEPSCWRADDGGQWDADSWRVLGGFLGERGLLLAVTWSGPEGETAMVLPAYEALMKEAVFEKYRYWSPE